MKKKKEEEKQPYIIPDDVVGEGENKYDAIVRIATEIKRRFEITGQRDNSIISKILEEFRKK